MSVKSEDLKADRVKIMLGLDDVRFVRFKGMPLMTTRGTYGFRPVTSELFKPLVYDIFGHGISKTSIGDLRDAVENVSDDWSDTDRYIGFGDKVWDMDELDWDGHQTRYVYSSRVPVNTNQTDIDDVQSYLLSLADGDSDLAHDYLQIMAPLFMYTKPMGIVWLLGKGANGKSVFLQAWWNILGSHFAEQSLDMIEDGRSAPSLRGILGNIVREASEKRIEDDKHYKNIGAHETFPIRILGSSDTVTVDANFHTVINANNAPVFEDKSDGATRRTLLVPFPARFKDDPNFKRRVFTPAFLGALLHLTLMETRHIRDKGYHWSEATKDLQQKYIEGANTAEAYARHLDETGIVGFTDYRRLHIRYEVWCDEQSLTALGKKHLKAAVESIMRAYPVVYRENDISKRMWLSGGHTNKTVDLWDNGLATAKDDKPVQITEEQVKEQAQGEIPW